MQPTPPVVPPIWHGRRGVINTALCGVLAVVTGIGLLLLAQRSVIVPACAAYADTHSVTYADFKIVGLKRANNVVCLLTTADGKTRDVRLSELVPTVTDMLASFAVSLEFTIPLFALLFAVLRVVWYKRMGT